MRILPDELPSRCAATGKRITLSFPWWSPLLVIMSRVVQARMAEGRLTEEDQLRADTPLSRIDSTVPSGRLGLDFVGGAAPVARRQPAARWRKNAALNLVSPAVQQMSAAV